MKKNWLIGLFMAITLLLSACGTGMTASSEDNVQENDVSTLPENQSITVFAAASLTDALNEISEKYKEEVSENADITFTFGASGALQTQIEEGAPGDIFFSAAEKQMNALKENDFIQNDTIINLLENQVVLIVPADSDKDIKSFEDLATDKVSSVAIGEPSSVPVGQYTEEILSYYNIKDAVNPKANYATDVRQVLTWVEEGTVDCGIVYSTDAKTTNKVTVAAIAPSNTHTDVIYPVGILKEAQNEAFSKEFLKYLSSDSAKSIFESHGFLNIK